MSVETRPEVREASLERNLLLWLLKRIGTPLVSVRLWNGEEIQACEETPVACIEIRDRKVLADVLRSPTVGFGEAYSAGLIEVHGDFLGFAREITTSLIQRRDRGYLRARARSKLYAMSRNTLDRSRANVHHHYDVGNDFYRLWLDERMVYTCAYYPHPEATLAEAQVAKLDHVCRKLQLQPGQKVIEAGCGWGALALHMAEHYGVNVIACESPVAFRVEIA